jgi:hypothetical protein
MTLTELQNEVYLITNRPDMAGRTLSAIRAATLRLHQMDFFAKDLFETGVVFSTPAYLQQLEYRPIVPRWRALKYIRKTDSNQADNLPFLTVVTPELIVDAYGSNRSDICYMGSEVINIRSSTELQYILLGCYVNPAITETGYSSWIATEFPFAIVYEAAAEVFKSVGKTEEFAAHRQMAQEQRQLILISNIQQVGY